MALTVQEVITDSLEDIGVTQVGNTPTTVQLAKGLLKYNSLVKNLIGKGLDTWPRDTQTLDLTADKLSYTVATGGEFNIARPINFINGYRTQDSTDTPITMYSKIEYFRLSQKDSSGVVTQWYYDQKFPTGNLFIWPVPAAADLPMTLTFDIHTSFVDQALVDTITLPNAWELALTSNLSVVLAKAFGRPVTQDMKDDARTALDNASGLDQEEAPTRFIPSWRVGQHNA